MFVGDATYEYRGRKEGCMWEEKGGKGRGENVIVNFSFSILEFSSIFS